MPDERPPHPRIDAHELILKAKPLRELQGLGPRGEEVVGRPLDEPAIAAHGREHAADTPSRLDEQNLGRLSGGRGTYDRLLGGRQPGHAATDDNDALRKRCGHRGGYRVRAEKPPLYSPAVVRSLRERTTDSLESGWLVE